MIPTYRYSVSSPMPIDLNEDHTRQASSSSSSLSCSILFNPGQDQGGYCYWESKHLQSDEEAEKIVPSGGSWDHPAAEKCENRSDPKLRVWKKEEECENLQGEDSSTKWVPLKMRMMRRMMVSNQTGSDIASISNSKKIKYEEKNPPVSPLGTDDSNYNSSSNHTNITVRVCADCHTTKTPLWRSGPNGPKSLCNACGIRQRKARRAIAAAATANGTNLMEAAKSQVKKGNKLHSKRMKSKTECAPQLTKKRKLEAKYRKRFGTFEDLTVSLSKNLALQQVFPQDEKEAAILLMALSYGLLHGFPSDRYITN
ncbi:putative GATA transcription factor 22, partial [Mucuna pruriens]